MLVSIVENIGEQKDDVDIALVIVFISGDSGNFVLTETCQVLL